MAKEYTVKFVGGARDGETGKLEWDSMESPINTKEEIDGVLYVYSRSTEPGIQLFARVYGAGGLF